MAKLNVISPELILPRHPEHFVKKDALRRVQRDPGGKSIARSLIEAEHNRRLLDSYRKMGIDFIQWRSRRDERVRDSHRHLDGQVVRIGDHFENGLLFPGDPTYIEELGEEIYGCRCRPLPYFVEGNLTPPAGWFFPEELFRTRGAA